MNIQEISDLYAKSPQVAALVKLLEDKSVPTVFLQGLVASAAPMMFASAARRVSPMCLFVLNDAEEAGYFYHDLTQIMGNTDVLFFPSSYRRQVKYGQRDPASEILRTEVLSRLSAPLEGHPLYVVTCPEALSELVVSRKKLDERTLLLRTGDTHDVYNWKERCATLASQRLTMFTSRASLPCAEAFSTFSHIAANILSVSTFSVMKSTLYALLKCRASCRATSASA